MQIHNFQKNKETVLKWRDGNSVGGDAPEYEEPICPDTLRPVAECTCGDCEKSRDD